MYFFIGTGCWKSCLDVGSLPGKIRVIHPPVSRANELAFYLFCFNCILLSFFAAFRADRMALRVAWPLFNNASPNAEIRGSLFPMEIALLYPSPYNCERHMEIAFCFGGLALSDFLAAFSDGFHFPNAVSSLETLKAAFTVNVMLQ